MVPPRALVCANDEIALGAFRRRWLAACAYRSDLAVTGWDDVPLAALTTPPLTTIRQPIQEMGAHTVHLLLARIAARNRCDPADLVLPTEPVIAPAVAADGGMTGMNRAWRS